MDCPDGGGNALPAPHRRRRAWTEDARGSLAVAAIVLLAGLAGLAVEQGVAERERHEERAWVLGQLATLRARLEGTVLSNLLLARGLVAEIALDPDITQERFAALARELLEQPNQLRNIGAARDLVIGHMYPVEGNEAALGLDYRQVASQRGLALRARDQGRLAVAGPVTLVQGGRGLIGRSPVFTTSPGEAPGSGPFWGLVSIVIDMEATLAHAGLRSPDLGLHVALRGVDGLGARGAHFEGDPALFDGDPVLLDVALPDGSWQMAAVPTGGWTGTPTAVWQVRGATGVLAVLLGLVVWLHDRHHRERKAAQRELEETRARLADAIESLADGFALWDPTDRLVLCNARFSALGGAGGVLVAPGIRYEDLLRRCVEAGAIRVEGDAGAWIERTLGAHRTHDARREIELADGRCLRLAEHPTADGGTVGVYNDITEMRRAEADIRFRANFDALTGLPNRAFFQEHLETAIARARRSGHHTALLFVDLDRFKNINDSLGHTIGDDLLREAARRIVGCVRSTDTVARLGGDEFTVILGELGDGMTPTIVSEAIIERLSRCFELGGYEVYAGASIGITLCPEDGEDADTLLKNADLAMYRAKEAGRNTFRYFTQEMTARAQRFVSMENDLRRALASNQLHLHYQQIVAIDDGRWVGVEALLRWEHPEQGAIAPDQFIPVAEESGLIVEIGEWVLRRACEEIGRLTGLSPAVGPRLSINVSSRQFRAGFGADVVARLLGETGFPPERLVMEITESLLLERDERIRRTLQKLREMGVGLSVDDFGTGFSSLSYLRRFPVSELKIDREFIKAMDRGPGDAQLVESIVAMARALGLVPVAEGVETVEQARVLRELGCKFAQGYHFGRPRPAGQLWPGLVVNGGGD